MRSTREQTRSVSSRINRAKLILRAKVFLQQLRRAPNAGHRILDLVRQHGGHGRHGQAAPPVRRSAVDLVGDGSLLYQQNHVSIAVRQGCRVEVDEIPSNSWAFQGRAIFGNRRSPSRTCDIKARSGLSGGRKSWIGRPWICFALPLKKLFARTVDEGDATALIDNQNRQDDTVQDTVRVRQAASRLAWQRKDALGHPGFVPLPPRPWFRGAFSGGNMIELRFVEAFERFLDRAHIVESHHFGRNSADLVNPWNTSRGVCGPCEVPPSFRNKSTSRPNADARSVSVLDRRVRQTPSGFQVVRRLSRKPGAP